MSSPHVPQAPTDPRVAAGPRPLTRARGAAGPAVVFGRVSEGTGLLKKLDALGSRGGKPAQRVTVADCGELPSRRQIMAKLQVPLLLTPPSDPPGIPRHARFVAASPV